ncbi:MAG: hypothetical protein GOU98_02070 [Candidatus Altiarchaeota archaeon]|nr:hypothetical protein [Candidatus Altiarchaeota archaeon]
MGVAELPLVASDIIQKLIVFGITILITESYFTSLSSSILLSQEAVKGDSLANAMSTISMHESTNVSITWDGSAFVAGVSDGALLMIYSTRGGSVSPYPAVYAFPGSVAIGDKGFEYYGEVGALNFSFSNNFNERSVIVG